MQKIRMHNPGSQSLYCYSLMENVNVFKMSRRFLGNFRFLEDFEEFKIFIGTTEVLVLAGICFKNKVIVLREQHFGFVPFFLFFFSYAADLSLFLETGKGLTCAVFTEIVDLRPD